MIKRMRIENFKCFHEFDIELDRFNVLVGPNGSGKTAFLQAITIVPEVDAPSGPPRVSESELSSRLGIVLGREAVWRGSPDAQWSIEVSGRDSSVAGGERLLKVEHLADPRDYVECRLVQSELQSDFGLRMSMIRKACEGVLGKPACFRLSPRVLKEPCELRPDQAGMDEDGRGFAAFLDSISRRDRHTFEGLEAEFCSRFPEYQQIVVMTGTLTGNRVGLSIGFKTRHGQELSAGSVSDGTILSLAFLAVCCQPAPPRILLVEEPENGVHPGRLKQIVDTLKHLSEQKDVQMIVTTHSPYLLDLVDDEEVYVFQKDEEDAAHARKLSQFADVAQMKKDFMTGEIWSILAETQGI